MSITLFYVLQNYITKVIKLWFKNEYSIILGIYFHSASSRLRIFLYLLVTSIDFCNLFTRKEETIISLGTYTIELIN